MDRSEARQSYNANAAAVLRYLRHKNGLTQGEMASILGCSKYRLSRIEAGRLSLLSIEVTNVAQHFNVRFDDFACGQITRQLSSEEDFEIFNIPQRLKENPYSGGRSIFLHRANFKKHLGRKKYEELCKTEEVDPTYFVNLDNPMNMAFNFRLLAEMIRNGVLGPREKNQYYVRDHLVNSLHHDGFSYEAYTGLDRVTALVQNAEGYEKNHNLEVLWHDQTRHTIDVKVSLRDHVDRRLYFEAPWVGGFLIREFVPNYLSTFIDAPNRWTVLDKDEGPKANSIFRFELC